MKKQFIVNVLLLIVINLIVKPVYVFFVETQVQNTVGTEVYGLYFYHFNFVYLFQFIGDFGLQTWNNQYVSKNRTGLAGFLPSVIMLKVVLSLVWILAAATGSLFFEQMNITWILLIGINLLLSSWFLLIRSFLSGLGKYSLDSLMSSLDKLLMIPVIGYLLWSGVQSGSFVIEDFMYGQMVSLLVACLIVGLLLFVRLRDIKIQWRFDNMQSIFRSSIPYAIVLFLTLAYQKLDGLFLGFLSGDGGVQAGIYAASFRIYDAANMFLFIIPALVLPMFSFMLSQKQDIAEFYAVVLRWIFLLLGPVLVLTLWFAPVLLDWLYIEHINEKTTVLQWLMAASILVSFAYVYGALSMALDKLHKLIPVFISGVVVNIILLLFLVPDHGAVGASIATFCTQVWVFIGQYVVVNKYVTLPFPPKVLMKGLLYWVTLFVVAFLLKNITSFPVYFVIITSLIISLPLALLYGMLETSDIRLMFSGKQTTEE